MKTTFRYLFLVMLISGTTFSQSGNKNFIDQPYIEVTGKVETEIQPNEIYLKITINENDKKGKLSVETQENQLINTLKFLGIDIEKDFTILDFDGYYKKKFLSGGEVSKIKNYELMVSDGKTVGKVFEALDSIDISNVSIIRTSHSDIEEIRRNTKLKALKVAKEKANQYAQTIDQSIGKAIFIQEVNPNYSNNFITSNALNSAYGYNFRASNSKVNDLNLKTITISSSVLAKFKLN